MNKGGSLRDLSRSLPPFRLQFPIYGLLLSADEVRVNSRLCNQLLMPAFLHDASVIDNENLIGMTHGLESVRNHDDRLIARQRLDRLLQPILIFGIDVCRRLVQYDDRKDVVRFISRALTLQDKETQREDSGLFAVMTDDD